MVSHCLHPESTSRLPSSYTVCQVPFFVADRFSDDIERYTGSQHHPAGTRAQRQQQNGIPHRRCKTRSPSPSLPCHRQWLEPKAWPFSHPPPVVLNWVRQHVQQTEYPPPLCKSVSLHLNRHRGMGSLATSSDQRGSDGHRPTGVQTRRADRRRDTPRLQMEFRGKIGPWTTGTIDR